MKAKRFKVAIDVQNAVNFLAIVNTALLPALHEARDEGTSLCDLPNDPAVILLMDKLLSLMATDTTSAYSKAYDYCKSQVEDNENGLSD